MLGVVGKVFAGIAALVGIVALMSSPQQAAKTAGSSMGTVGITVGALAGSIPDLVTGFNVARTASNKSGINQTRRVPARPPARPNRPRVRNNAAR